MFVSLVDGALAGLHVFGIAIAHHFRNQSEIDLYEDVVRGMVLYFIIFVAINVFINLLGRYFCLYTGIFFALIFSICFDSLKSKVGGMLITNV
jgi:hypothetical protein